MNTKLQITNYKLIENLDVTLESSNVYIVSGDNATGKSTFLEAFTSLVKAKNDVKFPVTIEKESGKIIGVIENKNGDVYSVTMDIDKDGNTKFTMVDAKGLKTKSVTAIRDVFGYQDFTADEFISWGNTAEGRRKQAEILLQCFPKPIVDKYKELELQEKINYDNRTPVISEINHLKKRLEDTKLTETQLSMLNEKDAINTQINDVLSNYEQYSTNMLKYNEYISKKKLYDNSYNERKQNYERTISEAKEQIEALQIKIKQTEIELNKLNEGYKESINNLVPVEMPKEIDKEKIEKAKKMKEMLYNTEKVFEEHEDISKRYKEQEQLKTTLDDNIHAARKGKEEIIKTSKLFDNIFIEDDGIYINDNNNYLPFNDKQICTSTQIMLSTKILLKLNEKLPIVCIGRGESLGNKNIMKLVEIAKETNSIIVLEKVISDEQLKIEAVVYE